MSHRATEQPSHRTALEAFKLDGRVAVVTGSSRGLGAAVTVALAEAGADVVLTARTAGGWHTSPGTRDEQ